MSESSTTLLPPETPGPPEPPQVHPGRGRRLVLIAAVAVLVLVIPLIVIAAGGHWPWQQTNAPAAPSLSATPSLSDVPSRATPSSTAGVPAPDGRIPLAELRNATLDIPAWPADNLTGLSGRLTFVNGQVLSPGDAAFGFNRYIIIDSAFHADVDADGAQETIALVECVVQGGSEQLVAFDRDAAGNIVTIGSVVATTGEVRIIDDTTALVLDDATIMVRVGDFQSCCGDPTPVQYQDRGYRWSGHGFDQVAGPTSFPVNPSVTETGITTNEIVFGPAVDGVRHGRLTVTVAYLRGATPDHLMLSVDLPDGVRRDGADWPPLRKVSDAGFLMDLPTPHVGTSVGYTFAFSRPANLSGGNVSLYLRAGTALDRGEGPGPAGSWLSESNPFNQSATAAVRESN
jgi:hypothetical protein